MRKVNKEAQMIEVKTIIRGVLRNLIRENVDFRNEGRLSILVGINNG